MSTEVWWSQHHPFKSGLTGETAQQFCDAYDGGDRQAMDAADRLQARQSRSRDRRRSSAPRNSSRPPSGDAIAQTDYQSLVGPITWKGGPTNPVPNVCTTPLVGGQWKKGKKFKYDLNIVFNKTAPNIPLDSPFEPIKYS